MIQLDVFKLILSMLHIVLICMKMFNLSYSVFMVS